MSDDTLPSGLRADGLPDIEWFTEIPAGEYEIGANHLPRLVLESQSFTFYQPIKLAKYPITQTQFRAFMLDASFPKETPDHIVPYNKPALPRGSVWWSDSFAFARWLNQNYHAAGLLEENWVIDVPNEVEWELAARYPDGKQWRINKDILSNKTPFEINPDTGMHIPASMFREWCIQFQWYNNDQFPAEVDGIVANPHDCFRLWRVMMLRGWAATFRVEMAPTWDNDIGLRVACRQK